MSNLKTLKDFTPEIQAKIPAYHKKYLSGVEDGGRFRSFKKENAEKLINWNYEKCKYKKPVVLVAENIYEAQLMFNYLVAKKDIFLPAIYLNFCLLNNMPLPQGEVAENKKLNSQLYSQLDSQLDSQLYSQLNSQLRSQLYSQLDSQLRSQLYSQLDSQLDSQLYSQLRSQLRSQLYSQLRSQLYSQLRSQLRSQLDSQLDSQLYSQLRSQLRSQLYSQLRSQLYSQLRSQLRSQLDSQLDSQLYSQLNSQLRSQLRSQLDSQLDSQLYSEMKKRNPDYLFTTNVYTNAWLAWFKFMKDEFKIDSQIGIDLDMWNSLYMESGVYSAIFSELVCVVSKYPKKIHRDGEGRLHRVDGNAVEWSYSSEETRFDCLYIHGRNIAKEVFDKAANGTLTQKEYISEQNDETRSAWYEILGSEKLMALLEATLVDETSIVHRNGEIEKVSVFRTKKKLNKIKNEPYAWIKRVCPSTGSVYLTPTNPTFDKAIDAAKFHRPEFVPMSVDYQWTSRS